jgi:hypothetical protein
MAKVTDPAEALKIAHKGNVFTKEFTSNWCIKKEQFKEKEHAERWKKALTTNGFTCKMQKISFEDLARDEVYSVTGVRPQCPKCQTRIDAYGEPCCNLNCV